MPKIIITTIVLHCSLCAVLNAQVGVSVAPKTETKVSFLLNGGFNFASGKEISQVYGLGYILGMGVAIKFAANHFWITPGLGVTYFGNQPNESLRDDLFLWNVGTSVAWLFPLGKGSVLSLAPEFGSYYVSGNNHFRPRKDYVGNAIHVYSFKDFAFKPGLSLVSKRWKFMAAYNILHIKGKLDEGIKDEIETSAWGELNPPLYEMYQFPNRKFDMSHYQFSLTIIF